MPITRGELQQIADVLRPRLKALADENAALRARVEVLETRPVGLTYAGVWEPTKSYARDEGVTCSGSLWICLTGNTGMRPGTAPAAWRLAVKRGADGKSA